MIFSALFNFLIYFENFYYDAMQQYRYSNFSDVFSFNCIFVIDAVAKQLASRSFLNCGVSTVAICMAAHKIFFLNQIFTALVSLNSLWCCSDEASGGA